MQEDTVYQTSFGPDLFGKVRAGRLTEIVLSYRGFTKPEKGNLLRVSCILGGVEIDSVVCDIIACAAVRGTVESVLVRVAAPAVRDVRSPPSEKYQKWYESDHLPRVRAMNRDEK